MNWQVAAAAIGVLALPLEPMLVSLGAAGPGAARPRRGLRLSIWPPWSR
jgi:hypothetical protein